VLDVLVAAEGGVVSAEDLLARAGDENTNPFTNAVRSTLSRSHQRSFTRVQGDPPPLRAARR
jgi:two-component system response regulator VanR